MADINYDPFNDVTDPDAAVAGINASIASLFPPSALNPFLTLNQLSATAWNLDGNTNGAEKYIGTNDNFELPFRTNNNEVARFTTDGAGLTRFYINQTTNLHGSNAGIQYSTDGTSPNRSQIRFNLYGSNTGAPGVTTFKSRGVGIGALASVLAGDNLFRLTTIGVSGNNSSINLASLIDVRVAAVFLGYVATEFIVGLNSLAGTISEKFKVGSEGTVTVNNIYTFPNVDGLANQVLQTDGAGVLTWQTIGGGTATLTTNQIGFGDASNLMTSDPELVWNNTTKRLFIGPTPFVGSTKVFIQNTAFAEYGLIVRSAGFKTAIFSSQYAGTVADNVVEFTNASASTVRQDVISIRKGDHVATIGSATLMGFWNNNTGTPSQRVGTFGVEMTDVTAGTWKTRWVWTTTNETTGVLVDRMYLTSAGLLGIGNTPTAVADLSAATIARASLRVRSSGGINPTAPNAGDMWYDGTDMFLDNGALTAATRQKICRVLTGTFPATNFGLTGAQSSTDIVVALTGAALNDPVFIGVPNAAVNADTCYTAWVSSPNNVTIRFNNYSAGAIDPGVGTFKVTVCKN